MSSRTPLPKRARTQKKAPTAEVRAFTEFVRALATPGMEVNFTRDVAKLGWEWDHETGEFWKGTVRLDSEEGREQDPLAARLGSVWQDCGRLLALLQKAEPATISIAALAFDIGSSISAAHQRGLFTEGTGRPKDPKEKVFAELDKAEASFKAAKNTGDKKFMYEDARKHWSGGQELPLTPQKFTAWKKLKKARAGGIRQK